MSIWGRRDGEPPAGQHRETEPHAPAAGRDDDLVVLDSETAVKDPALAGTAREPAAAGPADEPDAGHGVVTAGDTQAAHETQAARDPAVTRVPPAADGAPATPPAPTVPADGSASPGDTSAQRWHEILAMFVDDPRGSLTTAADAVASAIDEFVNAVRARQRVLASSWQDSGTDTEQFRTALLDYRNLWHQVQQMRTAQEAAVHMDGKVKPG